MGCRVVTDSAWQTSVTTCAYGMSSAHPLRRSWNGTPITRRTTDGYVSATAMCKANGKLWGHFFETDRCAEYLEALSETIGKPIVGAGGLVQTREGRGGGTWVHPDVATELARWISASFSVFVNQWFREAVENQQQAPAAVPVPVATQQAFGFAEQILEALEKRRNGNKGISSMAAASGLAFHQAHNAGNVELTGHPAKHWRQVSGHDNWQQHADWPWQSVKGLAGVGSMAMVEQLAPGQRDAQTVRECIEFSHGSWPAGSPSGECGP